MSRYHIIMIDFYPLNSNQSCHLIDSLKELFIIDVHFHLNEIENTKELRKLSKIGKWENDVCSLFVIILSFCHYQLFIPTICYYPIVLSLSNMGSFLSSKYVNGLIIHPSKDANFSYNLIRNNSPIEPKKYALLS